MSAGAAAAAAAEAERQRQEEEEMTKYTDADLQGDWEFKIVRQSGRFQEPEVLQQVCAEEARAGWTLVEKFTINVCGSSVPSPHGPAMRDWNLILTVLKYGTSSGVIVAVVWPVLYCCLLGSCTRIPAQINQK